FLEHATGVNDLYVALTKKPGTTKPAPRGKPADDFARVPSAFRWVATEDLELPFQEYVAKIPDHVADRRLQPDAMLEDPARKRRYLIEFETGSATVRNSQHKTATETKIGRYCRFLLGPVHVAGPQTYYSKHFNDGYKPVVVFLTRTEARRDTIVRVAEAYWGEGERVVADAAYPKVVNAAAVVLQGLRREGCNPQRKGGKRCQRPASTTSSSSTSAFQRAR